MNNFGTNQEQIERWKRIEAELDARGENHYVWLMGTAPDPIKGLPQKYVVRKMNKITCQMYESKHTYYFDEAKKIVLNEQDFPMTKIAKSASDCIFDHCKVTRIGCGYKCRELLQYIVESTGEILIK